MGKDIELKIPGKNGESSDLLGSVIDRRKFIRYGFNATAGVLAATFGMIGFAAILMPGGGGGGGDLAVKYWAKGREDDAWYGSKHLQEMKLEEFTTEAAKSVSGMAGASGIWNGVPVNVVYVPHEENKSKPQEINVPRYQFGEGVDATGKYVGHFEDLASENPTIVPNDGIVISFGRCPHLCCIPGWQLVSNNFTEDSWAPGGTEEGGNKLFCICHSSRFDPTALEVNTNRNRANGQTFEFAGIKRVGGPAPVGIPLIPAQINGGIIEGLTDFVDWLTYCD
ncbi:MAG: hypothetical protein CMB64_06990 [Euryarchaeota archaeon]|nr:hypothetical protein [Euryarchaeota archaeon]|tara:strand:+ start:7 stop:849 length:843 start_codon:yes stop_codon:yes gene_type:complete